MTDLEKEDIELIAESYCDWNKLNNKTIMLAGGTGFIGSLVCDVIRYRNYKYNANIKVISLSRRVIASDDTIEYIQADVNKELSIEREVDYVLHLASNTHPVQYQQDPIGTITTNIIGCNNLLKYAVEHKAKRFLLVSSVEIYGQGSNIPMNEEYCGYIDCNNARSGYNESKRTCESLCQAYRKQYGIESVTVRLARTFGADKKNDSKAMAQFISKAVAGQDIVLKSKGKQRYSYCYVADAVSAIFKVLLEGIDGDTYNVSDDDEGMTLGEYAEFIASNAEKKVVFDIENNESSSKATYALLECKKLKSIGWEPLFSIKDALKRTYNIYIERNKV
ncbi:MAG: NAD-dependent epimerase/dehydratase family protein [Lachnospiraceae bacterium]|nr:NAD-dependent epimerase/dehydratase family protein [Lachnospiraceae bacterium]